jgi:hypothetical protein
LVQELLDHRPVDRLRVAGRLLRLAQVHSPERLERACTRARHFGEPDYVTVKRILQEHLDAATFGASTAFAAPPSPVTAPNAAPAGTPVRGGDAVSPRYAFVRHASEFVASLFGGSRGGDSSHGNGVTRPPLAGLPAGARP